MSTENETITWKVLDPVAWPQAPSWMSFSILSELQDCPRRWALSAAKYTQLWGHSGYPRSPQLAALEGTVVHLSLENITRALTKEGCSSLLDLSAISVLKKLGGFTRIIRDSLERSLQPYAENPRAVPVLEGIHRRLIAKVPEIRSRVQILLSRIRLESRSYGVSPVLIHHDGESRHPLSYGSYAEVELRVPELGWHGVADLLTISNVSVEIRDFKTGAYKEKHESQLRTYALLWARDRNLNPHGRLADKLVISYYGRDLEVPAPNENSLASLEDELRGQTQEAHLHLQADPPKALPSQENCAYCSVRHLCGEYWQWLASHQGHDQLPEGQFSDVQIKLISKHGPSSWDGVAESCRAIEVGGPMLLRTSNVPFVLRAGQVIRVLNICLSVPRERFVQDEPSPVVATMGTNTEIFLL